MGRFVGVNELLDLTARQVAADLRAAPAAARRRFSMDARAERCRTIEDLRVLAKRTVPKPVFDYVDGAANDEVTYRRNRAGFEDVELQAAGAGRRLRRSNWRRPCSAARSRCRSSPRRPGLTGLIHPDGEVAIAARRAHGRHDLHAVDAVLALDRGGPRRGVRAASGSSSTCSTDRGLVYDMLARAQATGYEALVLTVDVAVAGVRERDVRNRFSVPPRLTLKTLARGPHAPALVGGLRRPAADLTRQRHAQGRSAPASRATSTASSTRASPGTTSRACASTGTGRS